MSKGKISGQPKRIFLNIYNQKKARMEEWETDDHSLSKFAQFPHSANFQSGNPLMRLQGLEGKQDIIAQQTCSVMISSVLSQRTNSHLLW